MGNCPTGRIWLIKKQEIKLCLEIERQAQARPRLPVVFCGIPVRVATQKKQLGVPFLNEHLNEDDNSDLIKKTDYKMKNKKRKGRSWLWHSLFSDAIPYT